MGNNAYESGARKVIPAVLVYVENPKGDVLMLHRNAKKGDYHQGKYNGLGGKLEPDESPLEAAVRELREESGLDLAASAFRCLGVIQFPNFKAHKSEDWLVHVFTARSGESQAWTQGPEGTLEWIPRNRLTELNLWAGDRHFIPYVAAGRPFVATIWYEGERVTRHWLEPLA